MDEIPPDVGVPTGEPTPGEKIPKPPKKGVGAKAKKAGGDAAKKAAKKGLKMAAKAAARAIAHAAVAAFNAIVGVVGLPVVIGCLVITLIVLLVFGSLAAYYLRGGAGKTAPQRAGKDDPNIAKVLALTGQETGESGSGNMKLNFLHQRDLEYIQSGEIDKRLLAALVYLAERHEHIRVSHIVSVYEDMKTNVESGMFHDKQKRNNISAHQDGLAADIDEIDYLKDKCDCGDKIPVKVSWQTIGENPFGEAPDALNQIKGSDDLLKDDVKKALEKMGVKGLDDPSVQQKLKDGYGALKNINSPYDLTDPDIIADLKGIGITGIDNPDLQTGLKHLEAMQKIKELSLNDLSALKDDNVQALFAQAGIPLDDATVDQMIQYKKAREVLAQIKSPKDLKKPEVQQALQTLGVDTTNPDFIVAMTKITDANTIVNWTGDPNDPKLLAALATFGLEPGSDAQKALAILNAGKTTLLKPDGTLVIDPAVVKTLEDMGIYVNGPEAQAALNIYSAAYKFQQIDFDYKNPESWMSLQTLGFVSFTKNEQAVISKISAAQTILKYQGDWTIPQIISSMSALGIPLTDQHKKYVGVFQAAQVLASAAKGEISYDSPQVKAALDAIKALSKDDPKAKAATELGQSDNPDDPSQTENKKILGIDKEDAINTYKKCQAALNLSKVQDFSKAATDENIQKNLATLGLTDPKYTSALVKFGAVQTLLAIKDPSQIKPDDLKKTLQNLGVRNPKILAQVDDLAVAFSKYKSLTLVMSIKDPSALKNKDVQDALKNLGIKNPKVYDAIGKFGSVYTLSQIHSPQDLLKPGVSQALTNLGVPEKYTAMLGQAGSVYTLMQIKSPQDLLKPGSLAALNNLGIIDLSNPELLGQIGAIQHLMTIDSFEDLFNSQTILALNSLGLIALSGPVAIGLMALSFIDNMFGLGLFGDDCKASTDCYKPTAQENVYKVTEELLQMPYDLGDKEQYRVTQLIVYSLEYIRSKDPGLDSKLDQLYWPNRRPNVGLFTMPEAWQNIHIGY